MGQLNNETKQAVECRLGMAPPVPAERELVEVAPEVLLAYPVQRPSEPALEVGERPVDDNFEWEEGFWPRFGLIEIDQQNLLRRKVRFSALKFAEICKSNQLEYDI